MSNNVFNNKNINCQVINEMLQRKKKELMREQISMYLLFPGIGFLVFTTAESHLSC